MITHHISRTKKKREKEGKKEINKQTKTSVCVTFLINLTTMG